MRLIINILIILLLFNGVIFCAQMDIDITSKINMDKPKDICLSEYRFVVSFEKKFVVYNLYGDKILNVINLEKAIFRYVLQMNEKIINILMKEGIIKIFKENNIIKKININEMNILIDFTNSVVSDSTFLMKCILKEEKNDKKYINPSIIKMNINSEKVEKLLDFGKEEFTIDYVFKQDPINEKMGNIILGDGEVIIMKQNNLEIIDLLNNEITKVVTDFPPVDIDDEIKKYYNKKKPFIMKFVFPQQSPGIYKLYPLDKNKYLIDAWEDKAKRIKEHNLNQYILYYYENGKFTQLITKYNPDQFLKVTGDKIALYRDSELIVGEIMIIEER